MFPVFFVPQSPVSYNANVPPARLRRFCSYVTSSLVSVVVVYDLALFPSYSVTQRDAFCDVAVGLTLLREFRTEKKENKEKYVLSSHHSCPTYGSSQAGSRRRQHSAGVANRSCCRKTAGGADSYFKNPKAAGKSTNRLTRV